MTLSKVGNRQAPSGQAPAADGLTREIMTREILALAVVVVLGSIMTILDATIVNVALPTLGRDLHASISVIQWVPTVYLLAFASVIPLTGWISGRFGTKPVWLASLGLFLAGSLLAGLSGSIGALIGFRVLQGLGGGMIMPLGQSMLAQLAKLAAASPHAAAALAQAFGISFAVALAVCVLALVPTALIPNREA